MSQVTILDIQQKKDAGIPLTMMTAYDYSSALLADAAQFDMILVGDSLAMVMLGHESTVAVTMEEMLHHCRAVARGARRAFLIGDMPFMSYQADLSEAVHNAGQFLKEAGMNSVKLEGGEEITAIVRAIDRAGIPVMGHIGLTPQSVSKLGGYRFQGRTAEDAHRLLNDAIALQEAGCYAIVLEAIPAPVAEAISRRLRIPTIGIGAGAACDGQVLVYHDLLGLFDRFQPKFVKQYANLREVILTALVSFREEVEQAEFPTDEHTYVMNADALEEFLTTLGT